MSLRIRLLLDPARAFSWHQRVLRELIGRGHAVMVVAETSNLLSIPVDLLLDVEIVLNRMPADRAAARVIADDIRQLALKSQTLDTPDLILDLTGGAAAEHAADGPVIRPLYGGDPSIEGLVGALLDGQVPTVSLVEGGGTTIAVLRPAAEIPWVIGRALDHVFARVCEAVLDAVDRRATGRPWRSIPAEARTPIVRAPGIGRTTAFGAAMLATRVRQKLTNMLRGAPRWQALVRPLAGDAVTETLRLRASDYRPIPDDGRRYYADPVLFAQSGRTWLFLEEYPHATGKGIISVCELDPDGRATAPRPVLEEPWHLSYPFVFAHDGAIWMIPESLGAKAIHLYRADPFPDRWERVATLVPDVEASDATVVEHEGKWWLFAATSAWSSSSWDALSIWHAPGLLGPWEPHPDNPVIVDSRTARPAGPLVRRGDHWLRPAQDCAAGYGAALSVLRIDRLDPERFAQTLLGRVTTGTGAPEGPHTLSYAGGFEAIDLFRRPGAEG